MTVDYCFNNGRGRGVYVQAHATKAALLAIIDRHGNRTTIYRDTSANRNITQVTSPNGSWMSFQHDSSNRITDPVSNKISRVVDGAGRLVKSGEVAELVAFLASGRAASIHGVDYAIDGGTMPTV